MFEIFINNIKLILSPKKIKKKQSEKFKDNAQIIFIVNNMMNGEIKEDYCIYDKNVSELFQIVVENFTFIRSAGGLVFNDDKVLWIYRRGIWDLPKGGVEEGETLEETAVREIQEECGIKDISIENFLGSSLHMYKENNNIILKDVVWFKMKTKQIELTPQKEEEITKAEWKNRSEHIDIVANHKTHLSISNFLEKDKNLFL